MRAIEEYLDGLFTADVEETLKSNSNTRILSCILDAINSGIIILNAEEDIVFLNSKACRFLQEDETGLLKRHVSSIFLPDDRDILVPNILRLTRAQGEFEGEVMLRRGRDGRFMAYLAASYWCREGESAYIITINDISRIKSMEKMLIRKLKIYANGAQKRGREQVFNQTMKRIDELSTPC